MLAGDLRQDYVPDGPLAFKLTRFVHIFSWSNQCQILLDVKYRSVAMAGNLRARLGRS